MRLSKKEHLSLIEVFHVYGLTENCKIFLFGSRTDHQKRGGDIDLLLVCPEDFYAPLLEKKFRIKAELEFAAGEQRVDLTIATPSRLTTDPFLRSIVSDAVELQTEI